MLVQDRNVQNFQQPDFRARAKIASHFRIPSSGYLWPILNHKILERALLLLWFCDFGSNKANLNLGANSVKLFLREPLVVETDTTPDGQGLGHAHRIVWRKRI